MNTSSPDIIIVGGGLAGLVAALHLSQSSCRVCIIEKNGYPHHKVCGEYVSNEVLPYLNSLGIDPLVQGAKHISKFEMSDKNGNLIRADLPLGGFGISRYVFDELLFKALNENVEVVLDTVETIFFENEMFKITTQSKKEYVAPFVLGAFGKRSNIDAQLKRNFMQKPSPWLAVKAHYENDFPEDTVALHTFDGGYCGLSKTETNAVNACYLTTLNSFKRFGNIEKFQENVLSGNPFLKDFFKSAKPLFKNPLTISQVSFEKKQAVENHIFMAGDSAGLIHPLCGNGMAMAIHGAKVFTELFLNAGKNSSGNFKIENINREKLEKEYTAQWENIFSKRLWAGRFIQNILQHPVAAPIGFSLGKTFPVVLPFVIKKTHGASII